MVTIISNEYLSVDFNKFPILTLGFDYGKSSIDTCSPSVTDGCTDAKLETMGSILIEFENFATKVDNAGIYIFHLDRYLIQRFFWDKIFINQTTDALVW